LVKIIIEIWGGSQKRKGTKKKRKNRGSPNIRRGDELGIQEIRNLVGKTEKILIGRGGKTAG